MLHVEKKDLDVTKEQPEQLQSPFLSGEIQLHSIAFSLGEENTDPSSTESVCMLHSACFLMSLTKVFLAVSNAALYTGSYCSDLLGVLT